MKILVVLIISFFNLLLFPPYAHADPCSYSYPPKVISGELIGIDIEGVDGHVYEARLVSSILEEPLAVSEHISGSESTVIHIKAPDLPEDEPQVMSIYAFDVTSGEESCSTTQDTNIGIHTQKSFFQTDFNLNAPDLPDSPAGNDFTGEGLVGQIVTKILPIILGFAGFITVILIIISGLQLIFSAGNPEAAAAARGRLTMTLVGFAIILLAFALTQIVDTIFLGGSELL